ncbi:UDP-N-acetylmuramate--L-alanine ligase [Candidatus Kaiserbacteria bacterium]|nr:UDP-N-acetylmuramate--L-alanine ligase [Candidatus Kaiserbacteria bacterium]MCB9812571.1 UDP-N-acetylmuramate--L-alanine ligase [Candidatus Nomurabacteria bacterium]
MSRLDIDKIQRIHFIGIGGIGMSALARHFKTEKKVVSGSDRSLSNITKQLDTEGIQVFGEQVASNITNDIELIVYTEAMAKDHEEMMAAKELDVPMMNYFEALGLAMNPYYLIAVAGTHGKTTTTAMITDVFEAAGKDPTAVIGSLRAKTKSNYRAGKSKYAIVEACEYKRDFLSLRPDILVITNIEHEHVDYYKDLKDVQSAFRALCEQVNENGVIVTDTTNPSIAPVVNGLTVPVVNYLEYVDLQLPLKQPGMHNRLNAAVATAVAKREKISSDVAINALTHFAGTWRRFEFKGELNGAVVYDDYAHHPTEIRASINAARELYPDRKLVIAFQPHTFTRTKALFTEFAKAFGEADAVVLLPIYSAREQNESGVSSRELSVKALEYIDDARYVESIEAAEQYLRQTITDQDILMVMGAGDVTELAKRLTN